MLVLAGVRCGDGGGRRRVCHGLMVVAAVMSPLRRCLRPQRRAVESSQPESASSGGGRIGRALAVAHQWLVRASQEVSRVVDLPAVAAEVVEAGGLSAEVGALAEAARGTQSIFQVGIDLNLKSEVILHYLFYVRYSR